MTFNTAIDAATTTPTTAAAEEQAQTLAVLHEIRDELRDFNKDMDRLNALTEDQVKSTVENRKLTALTLMFVIPSTFAAIPGANFEHLNEYGFDNFFALPVLLGTVLAASLGTFVFVKKKGWL
ncbi:hypothetical protein [Streptomyces sp. NBC_01264]|uniref:hypothetical protein n=1 Tax=Streptomyces sp. NBC_01264 TaxID=2903804 RepID=UPI002250B105|nr:hypothetical protein [Streptomyces sp. NBC_01264]MCX4776647.1 hypothetical protein [Streptomyces sp. NBC_01264]